MHRRRSQSSLFAPLELSGDLKSALIPNNRNPTETSSSVKMMPVTNGGLETMNNVKPKQELDDNKALDLDQGLTINSHGPPPHNFKA